MTWTYESPQASNKDAVRYLVGDTDTHEQLVADEEILWQLTEFPNVRRAAAEVAQQLAVKFARQPTVRDGDTAVDYGARATQYAALAMRLKAESTLLGAKPYAGGITISDKQSTEEDTNRVEPAFSRSLFGERVEPARTLDQSEDED